MAKFYQNELVNYNRFIQQHPECLFLKPNQQEDVHQCMICNSEIVNFYAHCPACTSLKNRNTPVITCLDCYEEHTKDCANATRKLITHCKLSEKVVKNFVNILIHLDVELENMRQKKETLAMRLQKIESEDKNSQTIFNKKVATLQNQHQHQQYQHQNQHQNPLPLPLPQFQIPPIQIPKLNLQDIPEAPPQQQPITYAIPSLNQTFIQFPSIGSGQLMEEEKLNTLPLPAHINQIPPIINSSGNHLQNQQFDLSSLLSLRLPNPEEQVERPAPGVITHHHRIPEFTGFESIAPSEFQNNQMQQALDISPPVEKEEDKLQFLKDFLTSGLEPVMMMEVEKEKERENEIAPVPVPISVPEVKKGRSRSRKEKGADKEAVPGTGEKKKRIRRWGKKPVDAEAQTAVPGAEVKKKRIRKKPVEADSATISATEQKEKTDITPGTESENKTEAIPETEPKPKKKRIRRWRKRPDDLFEYRKEQETPPSPDFQEVSFRELSNMVLKLLASQKPVFTVKKRIFSLPLAQEQTQFKEQEQIFAVNHEIPLPIQAFTQEQEQIQPLLQHQVFPPIYNETQIPIEIQIQMQTPIQAQEQVPLEIPVGVKPEEIQKKKRRRRGKTTDDENSEKKQRRRRTKKPEEKTEQSEKVQPEPEKIEPEVKPKKNKETDEVVVKKRIRRTKEQLEADPTFKSRAQKKAEAEAKLRAKPAEQATPQTIATNNHHNPPIEETPLNVKRPAGMFAESDLTSFETIKKQPKIYNLLNQEDGSPIEATPMMRPMGMEFPSLEAEEIGWGLEEPEVAQDSGFEMEQAGQMDEGFSIPRLNLENIRNHMNINNIMNMSNILPFSIPQFPDNNGFNQM